MIRDIRDICIYLLPPGRSKKAPTMWAGLMKLQLSVGIHNRCDI